MTTKKQKFWHFSTWDVARWSFVFLLKCYMNCSLTACLLLPWSFPAQTAGQACPRLLLGSFRPKLPVGTLCVQWVYSGNGFEPVVAVKFSSPNCSADLPRVACNELIMAVVWWWLLLWSCSALTVRLVSKAIPSNTVQCGVCLSSWQTSQRYP